MSIGESVTIWIDQLRAGDSAAAQKLWELYFQRMVHLARRKLEGMQRAMADEEDVALSAFKSFCAAARDGRYPQLLDRDQLWPLLVAMTANKSVDLIRRENRQKRGGSGRSTDDDGRPQGKSRLPQSSLSQLISHEPTPDFAAELAELLDRLLDALTRADDPDLKVIALRRMQGDSVPEIAVDLGCVRRTVERKLVVIQRLWERAAE